MKKFIIDGDLCLGCGNCAYFAQENIDPNFFIVNQPQTITEESACMAAMNACPGGAISET